MRAIVFAPVIIGLLAGCGEKSTPDSQGWFVESYENGIITIQHGGLTYKAKCTTPDESWNRDRAMEQEGTCDRVVELVGRTLRNRLGDDDSTSTVEHNVYQQGSTLFLRSPWPLHGDPPWVTGQFEVISVAKTPRAWWHL